MHADLGNQRQCRAINPDRLQPRRQFEPPNEIGNKIAGVRVGRPKGRRDAALTLGIDELVPAQDVGKLALNGTEQDRW